MGIEADRCDVCGLELSSDNYYYIYTGRLQQGVSSNPKGVREYKMCSTCFSQIEAELIVSVQKRKGAKKD